MTKQICFLLFVLFSLQGYAQTGIGTSTPHASAKLDVTSTNKGFLPPRMTRDQRLAISNPAEGLMVYQSDGTTGLYYRGATDWIYIINSSNNVLPILNGGTGTTTSTGSGGVVLSTSPTLVTPTLGIATGTSLSLSSTTASTSTTTGALTVAGGAGIGGALNANTLSLSNSTIGISSLVLRNGDDATLFSDNPQIRMGWSGSQAGTSQFAQIIHTRHNSVNTNNAIDFYLSDGTANNTITNGSIRAMTIESPGNVTIAGKLNVSDPTGNVVTKVGQFVNAGTFVILDNVKVAVTTSGSRSLSLGAVSTSFLGNISGYYGAIGGGDGNAVRDVTYTTTASAALFGWHFPDHSTSATYILHDATTSRMYRITMMIGASYNGNFISIERLY